MEMAWNSSWSKHHLWNMEKSDGMAWLPVALMMRRKQPDQFWSVYVMGPCLPCWCRTLDLLRGRQTLTRRLNDCTVARVSLEIREWGLPAQHLLSGLRYIKRYTLCTDSVKCSKADRAALHSTKGWWPKTAKATQEFLKVKKWNILQWPSQCPWVQTKASHCLQRILNYFIYDYIYYSNYICAPENGGTVSTNGCNS